MLYIKKSFNIILLYNSINNNIVYLSIFILVLYLQNIFILGAVTSKVRKFLLEDILIQNFFWRILLDSQNNILGCYSGIIMRRRRSKDVAD
jgi:hypothetical protein